MAISAQLVVTLIVCVSLVASQPNHDGKAKHDGLLDLLDKVISKLEMVAPGQHGSTLALGKDTNALRVGNDNEQFAESEFDAKVTVSSISSKIKHGDTKTGCSFTTSGSFFMSPNYPNMYNNNLDCHYRFSANNNGNVLELRFIEFSVEYEASCNYDSLSIYNGYTTSSPLISKLCGDNLPGIIRTTQRYAYIVFKTDSSVPMYGFKIHYSAVDVSSTQSSGLVTSPNYPSSYSNSLDNVYDVTVSNGKIIQFTVNEFILEPSSACTYDYLEVTDGNRLLGKYCGTIVGGIPASTGNVVAMRFKTDSSVTTTGFSIGYVSANPPTSTASSCGLVSTTTYRDDNRIINGLPASANALPWQIELRFNGGFICGGSIIHNSWILTAAHCITANQPASKYSIVAGSTSRSPQSSTAQTRTVTNIIIHSGYTDQNYKHDIALLKVSPLSLNNAVRTICIPTADAAPGTPCTISGWGNTVSNDQLTPNYPSQLLATTLYIRESSTCATQYASFNYEGNKQVCGGSQGKDTCQGDSGGPFASLNGRRYFLEGVTSYGYGCAQGNTPGVYTRVRWYASWIYQNTNGAATGFNG